MAPGWRKKQYKVFGEKTYALYGRYEEEMEAVSKGEELKLSGSCWDYKVVKGEDGYRLWIH